MVLTYLFIILGSSCYAVSQSVMHGKFNLYGGTFWDASGWKRKYKVNWMKSKDGQLPDFGKLIPAPNTWYYRFFNIEYKERFPLSATLLVLATDAYHLFQFFFKVFLFLAFVPHIGFVWSAGLWVIFSIVFTLVYKYSQK